jgi:hypothetical protein
MIPLIRGAETAVLEDASRLDTYQARGRERVTWVRYWAARRAATDATMERLIVTARLQASCAPPVVLTRGTCRYCRMGPIVRPLGATPWCRACKRLQVDDAKQR